MKKIEILMDYRESNIALKAAITGNSMISLKLGKLKTGDFLINNLLLVERKTFKDLVLSIKDGRLFKQAARLASSSKYNLIILEGASSEAISIRMERRAIQGALISLSLKFRIPILRSTSPDETVKLLIIAYNQLINDKLFVRLYPNRPGPMRRNKKLNQQIIILQCLPGIGPEKAKVLLKKFGTLKAIFSSSSSELKKVHGIGDYLSERIVSLVNEERFENYNTCNLNNN